MTKEISKKEDAALMAPMENVAWGSENIDAADVVIPKLLLMQGLSELVSEGRAAAGNIVRSTNGETLGGKEKPVEIIAFMNFKTWVLSENTGSRYEFRTVQPITPDNCNAPLEWMEQGKAWRRDRCLNFYVLLPSDIKKEVNAFKKLEKSGELPDPNDALLPCVLSFRRTSYGAGRDLASHFLKAASFKQPPAVSTFKLSSKLEKNEQGSFHIFTIEPAGRTSPEDLAVCKKWYNIITHQASVVRVDDSDLKKPAVEKQPFEDPTPKRQPPKKKDLSEEIDEIF